eukprot:CAMPEP_0184668108 /NCGR_PEP_ID=MMETSP0308-20130426/70804_1 /TAXON_ID=38269 /ORGANISM="Gloeochaete witrockiana, Strain SAG 46.84" /LENGTH=218 /DNA_ID=CAMNT_0027113671 /DNA_START=201 /DNA_END=857 /DNA_ORIENTATION=+
MKQFRWYGRSEYCISDKGPYDVAGVFGAYGGTCHPYGAREQVAIDARPKLDAGLSFSIIFMGTALILSLLSIFIRKAILPVASAITSLIGTFLFALVVGLSAKFASQQYDQRVPLLSDTLDLPPFIAIAFDAFVSVTLYPLNVLLLSAVVSGAIGFLFIATSACFEVFAPKHSEVPLANSDGINLRAPKPSLPPLFLIPRDRPREHTYSSSRDRMTRP